LVGKISEEESSFQLIRKIQLIIQVIYNVSFILATLFDKLVVGFLNE